MLSNMSFSNTEEVLLHATMIPLGSELHTAQSSWNFQSCGIILQMAMLQRHITLEQRELLIYSMVRVSSGLVQKSLANCEDMRV